MAGKGEDEVLSAEAWLSRVREVVPVALDRAGKVKGFVTRWRKIISRLEQIPSCLSDLSSHPCFSKNVLCKEQLQAVAGTVSEVIALAGLCLEEKCEGKLKMQNDLDTLSGKLDLNLRDCRLLIKTGVLGEATVVLAPSPEQAACSGNLIELLARLQIGHLEAKEKALDQLFEIMEEDEKTFLASLGRSNVSALIQLLTATSSRIREKAVTIICNIAESGGGSEKWLISEDALPPLVRILESGSGSVSKEKALLTLQRLSTSGETARAIVGHGGMRPLTDLCRTGDSVSQAAAACTLRNISGIPENRQTVAEADIVKVMVDLLNCGILPKTREYAAEFLQHLTTGQDNIKKSVIREGGVQALLGYIDGPLPKEPAAAAIRNVIESIPTEKLVSLNFLPRLARVLKSGSPGAQQAAASAICKLCCSPEMIKLVGETECIIPLLINLLEVKSNATREVSSQALSSLMTIPQNCKEVKRIDKSVPNLVQLLDSNPNNTAKKYAVSCLLRLSYSSACRRTMVSYGAVGYLRKLTEMGIPGSAQLVERLEKGKLWNLFA
ncbi:hypothetical protein MLD38_018298 [Melastoma candidum]|uniref:Uncharacterized protein n=1 Tax=Melastoma candidum TaxID=119954 RepID=A0ACB9QWW8_9MYRT|nr:hypothetical protein MLD38_018298 [Melastoma candidum]